MKKTVMLMGFVLLVVSGVFAQVSVAGQTWGYKYVESVHPSTGIRYIDRGYNPSFLTYINYITFTNNSCYGSNEKGIKQGPYFGTYNYQGENNNLFVYVSKLDNADVYLSFSKDYKRINKRFYYRDTNGRWEDIIEIYERVERVDPSKGPEAPTQLW